MSVWVSYVSNLAEVFMSCIVHHTYGLAFGIDLDEPGAKGCQILFFR